MTTPRARLLRDGAWVIIGQLLAALGFFAGTRLLTEITEPKVYGELALVLGLVALAQGLSNGPLMQAALRFFPQSLAGGWQESFGIVLGNAAFRAIFIASLSLLVCWGLFCIATGAAYALGPALVVLLIVESRKALEITLLNAVRKQRQVTMWLIADAWLRPLLAFVGVIAFGATPLVIVCSYCIGTAILLYSFRAFRFASVAPNESLPGFSAIKKRVDINEGTLWHYAVPLIPLALLSWVSAQLDRYIIGSTLGVVEVGIYAAIYGAVSRPILMVAAAIELTMRPVYYEARAAHDVHAMKRIRTAWLSLLILSGICGTTFIGIFHRWLAILLLAEPYRQVSYLMPVISLGYSILVVAQFYERLCYAHDQTSAGVKINGAGALASIAVAIPAIRVMGLNGAAYAVPLYFLIQLIAAKTLENRMLRNHPQ
jgi:O-antigen/teichoic acid export membrane protein